MELIIMLLFFTNFSVHVGNFKSCQQEAGRLIEPKQKYSEKSNFLLHVGFS